MTDTTAPAERPFLDRYFRLSESGTDVRTEVVAGLTTFLTMVYIVFVNPQARQHRDRQGRGVRRDLHRVGRKHPGDGALRKLPDRARPRHGAQRFGSASV
jgi:hypothetical protein